MPVLLSSEIPVPLPYTRVSESSVWICGSIPLLTQNGWTVRYEDTTILRGLSRSLSKEVVHLLNVAWQLGYMDGRRDMMYEDNNDTPNYTNGTMCDTTADGK